MMLLSCLRAKNSKPQRNKKIIVRPDSKGRINLGERATGISSYKVNVSENGKLILIPYIEIPFSEKWIFDNEEILEKVKQHLKKEKSVPVA